jgi:hypothetical protein
MTDDFKDDYLAVTRGGPDPEFNERSGISSVNLAGLEACYYCGRPAAYRDLDGRAAHTLCAGESSEESMLAKINTRNMEKYS